ncbi:hypothetical protein [Acidipropionibacterium timonense]|uniref:hypothetical protein n=1 Tax=Acidipropionibacterium timonense TaxID=2161818 RepID=UPI0010308422|nr:hypothetical protein [Acidipropionibacterium timonense]
MRWWRDNRWGLLALLLLVPLRVAANSYRYVQVFRPHTFSHEVRADAGGTAHLDQVAELAHPQVRRVADVTLIDAARDGGGERSVPTGMSLWHVTFLVRADPGVPMTTCEVSLLDGEGRTYQPDVLVTGKSFSSTRTSCVPFDNPGPSIDPLTGALVPEGSRPPSWQVESWFALPTAVSPTQARIR